MTYERALNPKSNVLNVYKYFVKRFGARKDANEYEDAKYDDESGTPEESTAEL